MWRQGVSITFIIMLRLVLFQKMTNFVIKANIIILNKAWMETCEKGRSLGTGFHQTLSICFFSFWSFGFMWKESSDVNTTRTRVHRKSFVIFRNEIIFPKRLRTFHFFSLFLCWGPLTGAPRVPGAPEGPAGPDSPWKAKNRQTRFAADLGSKVNILTLLHRLK